MFQDTESAFTDGLLPVLELEAPSAENEDTSGVHAGPSSMTLPPVVQKKEKLNFLSDIPFHSHPVRSDVQALKTTQIVK